MDENCIEFESQTGRNSSVDLRQTFLSLKMKLTKSRGYKTYNPEDGKKEHRAELKEEAAEHTAGEEMEEDPPIPLVAHVNNFLHSTFSHIEMYVDNEQFHNSNGLYAYSYYSFKNIMGTIAEYKVVLHGEGSDYEV